MRTLVSGLFFSLAVAFVVAPAGAVVVFDNGGPNQLQGHETTFWVQADDFVLGAGPSVFIVTDFHFWTLELGTSAWDGTLDYFIFNDNAGQPAAAPFVSGAAQNIVKTLTGNTVGSYDEYEYSFDLASPVNLNGGIVYWFGLHLSSNFDRDEIYWEATNSGFGSTQMQSQGGTFDNWEHNLGDSFHLAFQITGEVADGAAIPEPVTAGLGLLGFVALAAAATRRRAGARAGVGGPPQAGGSV